MSYKIHLIRYNHNSNVPLDEIFSKVDVFECDYKVDFHFHFNNHKYLEVEKAFVSFPDVCRGQSVAFRPFIYDGDVCLNEADEVGKYYNHPDYFVMEFVLPECFDAYDVLVTSLKHEYRISVIKEEVGEMIDDVEIISHVDLGD
jgi:hypothetical protein